MNEKIFPPRGWEEGQGDSESSSTVLLKLAHGSNGVDATHSAVWTQSAVHLALSRKRYELTSGSNQSRVIEARELPGLSLPNPANYNFEATTRFVTTPLYHPMAPPTFIQAENVARREG